MPAKIFFIFLFLALAAYGQQLVDSRDNKKYKTVKIGTQTWMAENLNYNADSSKCHKNQPANCNKYGRLYDWNSAKTSCPKSWHLPSNEEWDALYHFADSSSSEYTDSLAYYRLLDYYYDDATWNDYYKNSFFSVRCVRDL